MNKVRFLTKIAMAASIFAALTFTLSCSDGKDSGGSTGKWCVYPSIDWGDGSHKTCGEIGAKSSSTGKVLTEESCKDNHDGASVEDEKPNDCEEVTTN